MIKQIVVNREYIIGIDEVGRGPLAGPVTVAGVLLSSSFDIQNFISCVQRAYNTKLSDSKGLKETERQIWNSAIKKLSINSVKLYNSHDIILNTINDPVHNATHDVMRDVVFEVLNTHPSYTPCFLKKTLKKQKTNFSKSKGTQNVEFQNRPLCLTSIKSMSPADIDTHGISTCITKLVNRVLKDLKKKLYAIEIQKIEHRIRLNYFKSNPKKPQKNLSSKKNTTHESTEGFQNIQERCHVFLDGGLHANDTYVHQSTHIKGDVLYSIISFASIIAKVHRDAYMKNLAKLYVEYGFETHKGYGTLIHRQKINRLGLTSVHRKNFCKNLSKPA